MLCDETQDAPIVGWRKRPLKELVSFKKGSVVPAQNFISEGVVPYIGADNFEGVYSQFTRSNASTTCKSDDVLMLWDGERSGLCAIGLEGVIGSTVARLRPLKGVDAGFLYYQLSQNYNWIQLNRTGTGVPHVPRDIATRLQLLLPDDTGEQHRIAQVLTGVGNAIKHAKAIISKLGMMRDGMLKDLLTRGMDQRGKVRPLPEQAPDLYCQLNGEFIPRGWIEDQIKNRASVSGGKRLPDGHRYANHQTSYRYLRVVDFFKKRIRFEELENLTLKTFEALARYEIKNGDVFISIAGSLGYAGTLKCPDDIRIILTENAAKISVGPSISPEFLSLQINSSRVQSQIHLQMGIGGGVPKLALFRIENLRILVPKPEEQQAIVDSVSAVSRQIDAETRTLKKLLDLKAGIMTDLLNGRVRVATTCRYSSPANVSPETGTNT